MQEAPSIFRSMLKKEKIENGVVVLVVGGGWGVVLLGGRATVAQRFQLQLEFEFRNVGF